MEQVENRISRTENKVEKLHQVRQRKMLRKIEQNMEVLLDIIKRASL
jgi:hypothetical protein